jgi:2-oxo-4-hydroxy-4-carboxy-5-ureidoimidazoline decarboxylase
MKLEDFNKQGSEKAREDLFKCCGSIVWVNKLMDHFPFSSIEDLKITSDRIWYSCNQDDWLEAFSHHPKIGEKAGNDKKYISTKEWAEHEQSGVNDAEQKVLSDLETANKFYEKKFGYIFIVCATGKTASEMLYILNERIDNDPEKELHIAAGEQNKITHLRIDKLLS